MSFAGWPEWEAAAEEGNRRSWARAELTIVYGLGLTEDEIYRAAMSENYYEVAEQILQENIRLATNPNRQLIVYTPPVDPAAAAGA
jgi:hypothetical protein